MTRQIFKRRGRNRQSPLIEPSAADSTVKSVRSSIKNDRQLIATASNMVDAKAGEKLLEELIASRFDAQFGGDITTLKDRITFHEGELKHTQADLNVTRREEAQTKEWVQASYEDDQADTKKPKETKWPQFQTRHKIETGAIYLLLPPAMLASAVTAHANLVGTGLPVFLDNPVLPWTMAGLAPMSGLAIKSMWSGIRSERKKSLFSNLLSTTTLVSITTWVWLFSDQYHGLSSATAIGGVFDEPTLWETIKSTAFVGVTMVTEILITAVLFHRWDVIMDRYAPNPKNRNHDNEVLQAREAFRLEQAVDHAEEVARLKGQLAGLEAARKSQIKEALADYWARRARFEGTGQ